MEKYFRTENGDRVNIVQHTLEQIEKWNNLKIYIGSDSQDYNGETVFATCIVYRYGNRGAHYIFYKEKVSRIKDMYSRLFEEAKRTIETAQLIDSEIPISFEALEFDYNYIPKFQSSKLISAVGGWAKGLGYKIEFKGSNQISTRAANHIVRK